MISKSFFTEPSLFLIHIIFPFSRNTFMKLGIGHSYNININCNAMFDNRLFLCLLLQNTRYYFIVNITIPGPYHFLSQTSQTVAISARFYTRNRSNMLNLISLIHTDYSQMPGIIIQEEPIMLTCKRCKNTWVYHGKNPYVATCSFCKTSISVKKSKVPQSGQDITQAQTVGGVPFTVPKPKERKKGK
jgi:hypothetical protein